MIQILSIIVLVLFGIVPGDSQRAPYSCGEPGSIRHGTRSILSNGGLVSYKCHVGYSLYGLRHIRCLTNGQWSEPPPICVASGCPPLPKFFSGRTTTYMRGAVVRYTCAGNTRLRGSPTIFCDGSQWNGTVPVCRGRGPEFLPTSNCPQPPTSPDTEMTVHHEYVTYRCVNRTQVTLGSQMLRCLPTGQWDRNPVVCARRGCPLPPDPTHGFKIVSHSHAVIEFRCFLDHHLIGSKYLYCNGREWNGTVPTCIADDSVLPETPRNDFIVHDGANCVSAPLIPHGRPSYSTERDGRGVTFWVVNYMCDRGYRLHSQNRVFCSERNWVGALPQCVAICAVNNGGCQHNCISTNGRAACTCRRGFRLHNNGRLCNDINECTPNGGRGPCDELCYNHYGSYSCNCPRGQQLNDDGHTCALQIVDPCSRVRCRYGTCDSQNGRARCRCQRGHVVSSDGYSCQDINECARSDSPCEHECRNTVGGYECSCPAGYAVVSGGRCQECGMNTYVSPNGKRCMSCPENSMTTAGRQTSVAGCKCKQGYRGNPGQNRICVDVNECLTRNGGCEHTCVNIRGGHICHCNEGYTLDLIDQRSCTEIDECAINNGGCQHQCRNSPGSFSCICNDGYAVNPEDRFTCIDVDECAFDSSRCEQVCVNYDGGYRCDCSEGFRLNRDSRTCAVEICAPLMPPPNGRLRRACTRLSGLPVGTRCMYECDKGYRLNGTAERVCDSVGQWTGPAPTCQPIQCPVIELPEFGQVTPARCTQAPGQFRSVCMFTCESGYNRLGSSLLKCTNDGTWSRRAPVCTRDAQIRCPEDMFAVLPNGTSSMTINLPEADHTLDFINSSVPLTNHTFDVGPTRVKYTAFVNNSANQVSCSLFVNVADEEAPEVVHCPSPFAIKIQERYSSSINIPEPEFTDNVAVTNVTRVVRPGGRMTWGTYTIHTVARDAAGNDAACTFTITIEPKAQDCGVLDGPLNGNHFCSPWLFGQICQPTCLPGFYFFTGPLSHPTYMCGADARWVPAKKVADCTAFELVQNSTAPCPAGTQRMEFAELDGPACMDCPRGMYSTEIGNAQPVCKDCPVGSYQEMTGSTSCHICPDGQTTAASGATSIRDCENSLVAAVVNADTAIEGDVTEHTPSLAESADV